MIANMMRIQTLPSTSKLIKEILSLLTKILKKSLAESKHKLLHNLLIHLVLKTQTSSYGIPKIKFDKPTVVRNGNRSQCKKRQISIS